MSKDKIIEETYKLIYEDDKTQGLNRTLSETQKLFCNTLENKYLEIILQDQTILDYNRFIYFSRIAEWLFKLKGGDAIALADIARLSSHLDIVYDVRTGSKSGCVYEPSYKNSPPVYNKACCIYFSPDKTYCNIPALDCSGFASYILDITGLANYPINEYNKNKMRVNERGTGNWNIFNSKLCKPINSPKIGCLIFFKTHIAFVTGVNKEQVTEITHSAKGGVQISSSQNIEWETYIESSFNALELQDDKSLRNNRYLLGEII